MLRDTPGGGVVSWHMKYKLKCIFIRFVQIYLEMWIIIPEKWGFEGTLHKWGFACTIPMSPLCFVTYGILHEINIELLRLHTPVMYINILKKWGFEGTIEDLKAQFINEDLQAQFIYHEHTSPLCKGRGV